MKKKEDWKKMTSKRRALLYIREKNWYRKAGDGSFYLKISNGIIKDSDFALNFIKDQIDSKILGLSKKFKMNFKTKSVDQGLHGDDFIKDMSTVLVKYRKA